MIDYHKIWDSINSESKTNPQQPQIARRIPSEGHFPVFLATDFRRKIRLLYIKIDEEHIINLDNLPRFKGLEIDLIITSLGEFTEKQFVKFSQCIPNSENIFELVISDICENVIHIKESKYLHSVLNNVLNEWKYFFEKQQEEILPISIQKGLVGELFFLRDFLFKKHSYSESLSYWTGSDRTNHDFQIRDAAIEIKTTSSKQHKKIIISSEKQLDSTGLEHLYLTIYALNLHSSMPDKTLPALIEEIRGVIKEDPFALFQFQVKLAKYGFNELHGDKYFIGFSIQEMKFFEIVEGFPRILQRNLPDGIGDLKYSIVVSACSQFEINSGIINLI